MKPNPSSVKLRQRIPIRSEDIVNSFYGSIIAPAEAAKEHGIRLEVVKLPEAKRGFVPAFATMGGRTLRAPGRHASDA